MLLPNVPLSPPGSAPMTPPADNISLGKLLSADQGFFVTILSAAYHITKHRSYENEWKNVDLQHNPPKFFKNMRKDVNKSFCYVKAESLYLYQFCENVRRQNATMMQLCMV